MFQKLQPLTTYLNSLTEKVNMATLGNLLRECDVTIDDVSSACSFSDNHYQRNKIASSDWYDLLIICWKPRQASLIHDHAGSSCGFKILQGTATEVVYRKRDGNDQYVIPKSTIRYEEGTLCLAQDADIHRISNENRTENLVTLHCYSPPLKMSYYTIDPSLQLPEMMPASDIARFLSGSAIVGEKSLMGPAPARIGS